MLAAVKRLVLVIVTHDDRWPFAAPFLWAFATLAIWLALFAAISWVANAIGAPDWLMYPVALTFLPFMSVVAVAGLLFYEPIWMLMGIYRMFDIKDHRIRNGLRMWAAREI